MIVDLSISRITRLAIGLGVAGLIATLALHGIRDAAGFLIGVTLSVASVRSWFNLAGTIGATGELPPAGSVLFLIVRYILIAGAVYATIYVLRSSPGIMILGLLVSFIAVAVDLALGQMASK